MRRAALLIAVAAALTLAAPLAAVAGAHDSQPVLGGKVYGAPSGHGWGAPHPRFIYNGGDASGSISGVHWSDWGGTVAHGRGRHPIFRPRGGYYRRPTEATDLGLRRPPRLPAAPDTPAAPPRRHTRPVALMGRSADDL